MESAKHSSDVADIKAMREKAGISIALLARIAGVTPLTLKRYEEGESIPTRETADRIRVACETISAEAKHKAGERLAFYRKELQMSRTAFAKAVGTTQSNLFEIEQGKRGLTEKTAKKIEDRFDIGKEWLMYGIESEKDYPVSEKLIEWIRSDPALRKELWERMGRSD